ncbi:MAG: hypothetical protein ACM31O_10015 [Bacteroidota bacterium]
MLPERQGSPRSEIAVADAHPLGARPFRRADYVRKFRTLAEGIVPPAAQESFLATVDRLARLEPHGLSGLTFAVDPGLLVAGTRPGIFSE